MANAVCSTSGTQYSFGGSQQGSDSPSVDEVVKAIVEKKRAEKEACSKNSNHFLTPEDKTSRAYQILFSHRPFDEKGEREKITEKENAFRELKPIPPEWDSYEPAGGLQWSLSLAEIRSYVQKKFEDLRKERILLFRSEFERQEKPASFRKPGKIFELGQKCGSLDRLWGAEYLRAKLTQKTLYRIPRFVLVIEDHVKTLSVKVSQGTGALFVRSLDTEEGEILAETVSGKPDCSRQKHGWLQCFGYVDYSDPGNILQTEDGNYYIVDTEWKSLDGVSEKQNESEEITNVRNYAIERFNALNPWISKTFEVDLKPMLIS